VTLYSSQKLFDPLSLRRGWWLVRLMPIGWRSAIEQLAQVTDLVAGSQCLADELITLR
jgi:hypothetical protein